MVHLMVALTAGRSCLMLSSSLRVQVNQPPAKLNLLTCQVKRNPEEKKSFDLFSRKPLSSSRHHAACR